MTDNTDEDRFTVTLKYGGDYAAPWTVIRGDTADQVKKTIIDLLGGLKTAPRTELGPGDTDRHSIHHPPRPIQPGRQRLRRQYRIKRKQHRHRQN